MNIVQRSALLMDGSFTTTHAIAEMNTQALNDYYFTNHNHYYFGVEEMTELEWKPILKVYKSDNGRLEFNPSTGDGVAVNGGDDVYYITRKYFGVQVFSCWLGITTNQTAQDLIEKAMDKAKVKVDVVVSISGLPPIDDLEKWNDEIRDEESRLRNRSSELLRLNQKNPEHHDSVITLKRLIEERKNNIKRMSFLRDYIESKCMGGQCG